MNPITNITWLIGFCLLPVIGMGQENWQLVIRTQDTPDAVELAYRRGINLISKQIDTRDATDLLLRSVTWTWNDNVKTWELSNQISNTYNSAQQLIHDVGQQWIGGEWVDQYRTTYVYNQAGLIRLFQYEAWTGINWELYVRFIHDYDDENRLQEFIAQDWIDNTWVNRYQRIFAYNDQLRLHSETRLFWQDDTWINRYRYTDYFDDHDRMKSSIRHDWIDHEWQYSIRNMFEYGSYDKPELITVQERNAEQWEDITRIQLAYNETGNLTDEIYHYLTDDYGTNDNGWTFTYDETGHMTERAFWHECEPYWQVQSHDVFGYDADNRNTNTLTQVFKDYWSNQSYVEFEYSKLTAVEEIEWNTTMQLFPNPVRETLQVILTDGMKGPVQLAIYSSLGERVWTDKRNGQGSLAVPVGFLASGNYVITVSGQAGIASQSFLKQ